MKRTFIIILLMILLLIYVVDLRINCLKGRNFISPITAGNKRFPGGRSMWVLYIAVIILLIIIIFTGTTRSDPHSESALDILKKRYASGEITKDEFDRIKADLEE